MSDGCKEIARLLSFAGHPGLEATQQPEHPLSCGVQSYAALARFCFWLSCESSFLAFSSSRRREAVRFLPPRLMKYVSIRIPDPGPFGETFREARVRAMVAASFVNRPAGGCVESVVTLETQRLRGFALVFECRGVIGAFTLDINARYEACRRFRCPVGVHRCLRAGDWSGTFPVGAPTSATGGY